MSKRVCVFVDGENFRHTICNLFTDFDRSGYLPRSADWAKLFDSLVREVSADGERVRTYWYVVEHMDFFPYRFPNVETDAEKLRRLLGKDQRIEAELHGLSSADLIVRMSGIVSRLRSREAEMRRRFDGWIAIQNGIASRHRAIEFRRAGAIRYNLFDDSLGPEKAVDVKLATDLIVLRDIYDVAVIVSGDQDYVPAVETVKDFGRSVVNVAFETRGGKLLPGGARRLNHVTDWSLCVKYHQFAGHLGMATGI
jgi:hypothetical protein